MLKRSVFDRSKMNHIGGLTKVKRTVYWMIYIRETYRILEQLQNWDTGHSLCL
jgi:hypothetical protein